MGTPAIVPATSTPDERYPVKMQRLEDALTAPFGLEAIEWRVQRSGIKDGQQGKEPWAIVIPYIDARAIHERLDAIVGPARWRPEFQPIPGGGIVCGLSLYLELPDGTWGWVTKWDGTGAEEVGGDRGMNAADTQKGVLSKAFKRAAVTWGLGRYLYKIPEGFARFSAQGRYTSKISNQRFKWDPPAMPMWALPAGPDPVKGMAEQQREHEERERRASRAVANGARR